MSDSPSPSVPPTPTAELDDAVVVLQEAKDRFASLGVPERIQLLREILGRSREVAPRFVAAALKAKGITPDSPTAAEEWLGGPMVVHRNIRLLIESLEQIRDHGAPQLPKHSVTRRLDGQVVAKVFPANLMDKLLYSGFSAEIWMEPGVSESEMRETMAGIYRGAKTEGKVALVLGAGNVASIGPMDVLYKMFTENQVCVLKMNPVNQYLGPFIEEAFAPAIEAGFLRVVYGGAEVGSHLVGHEGIDEIHITGSDRTHDAIVWGPPGPEQEKRKASGEPLMKKRITSELGNVSPVIVVPGPWTESELSFQAENIATMMANNASFNCNAAKLLIQRDGWNRREALLSKIEQKLAALPQRESYYPGAQQRYEAFLKAYPQAREIGKRSEDVLPWTLIPGVDAQQEEMCFSTEAFCSVLAETSIKAYDPANFIREAVRFCNDKVWGTLNVTLIVHPKTLKDPDFQEVFEEAVGDLRYGTVAVNHWAALGYGLVVTPWGAFPGHPLEDIQSGRGFVHNTLMFERPQKAVIRGPFMIRPRPPWFVTSRKSHKIAQQLTEFEAAPSAVKLPPIVWNAIRN